MNKVKLVIDCREHGFNDVYEPEHTTTLQLDIGDFHITYDNNLLYVIERKTAADLIASIKDGRYREQKLRLESIESLQSRKQIIYIIECTNTPEANTVQTCIFNMQLVSGYSVFVTPDKSGTVTLLKSLIDKLNDNIEKYTNFQKRISSSNTYCTTGGIKVQKKRNVDSMFVLITMLSSIPGISPKMADVIIKTLQCNNILDFSEKIKNINSTALLKDIKANNPSLRIGEKLINNLFICISSTSSSVALVPSTPQIPF